MRGRLAGWAAIALPIVLVLRVLLMIAQMPDKRSAPASVPEPGQVILLDAAPPRPGLHLKLARSTPQGMIGPVCAGNCLA